MKGRHRVREEVSGDVGVVDGFSSSLVGNAGVTATGKVKVADLVGLPSLVDASVLSRGLGSVHLSTSVASWVGVAGGFASVPFDLVGGVILTRVSGRSLAVGPVMFSTSVEYSLEGVGGLGAGRALRDALGGVLLVRCGGATSVPLVSTRVFFGEDLRGSSSATFRVGPWALLADVLLPGVSMGFRGELSLGTGVAQEFELGVGLLENLAGSGELEELLEDVLGVSGGSLPRSSSEFGGDVAVVIVEEPEGSEWHLLVAYLLRELLVEAVGSDVRVFVRRDVGLSEDVEPPLENLSRASLGRLPLRGVVEVFDTTRDPYVIEDILSLLSSRWPVLYSHGPGALVIAVSDHESACKLLARLGEVASAQVYTLKFESDGRALEEFANLALIGSRENLVSGNVAQIIKYRNAVVKETVRRLSPFVRRQVGVTGQVDTAQYGIKVATFAAIVRDAVLSELRGGTKDIIDAVLKAIEKLDLKVEESIGGSNVVPDITFTNERDNIICVEVESLTGTGEPLKKIDESVEKYFRNGATGITGCSEIWVVLKPEAALLHHRGLKLRVGPKGIYAKMYSGPKEGKIPVKVKVLTLSYVRARRRGSIGDRYGWVEAFGWELKDLEDFTHNVSEWGKAWRGKTVGKFACSESD